MVIKWSDFSKSNMQDFVKYSKMETPIKYIENLVLSVSSLENYPEAGKVLFYTNNIAVRQLIYKMHRIIYRIKDNEIHIGAVLHTSKDLESSLKFANRFFN
ncbi:MAG: type II toxin-antitoxin system RelE/ParE family toxin [Clostridia bacterium]|nr:type II toxin-antitoxin system RelE/ParE family toxin [Clostridia bacterium]